ncbi:MAG: AAA family ATPase [Lactimicrobium sp.]|uniref:AAA family ATPase n=1 Tax=Lactimicrobium sp. TaxID=2563780 RepID=UPI002F357F98
MKLLRVKADCFKNCISGYEIDFVARSKKTAEDKEYELQEVADGLFVYNTLAVVGKNASGKTTAMELLDAAYSILGTFRLEGKSYSYDNVRLTLDFYHDGFIYRYDCTLMDADAMGSKAVFKEQHIQRKKYYKTRIGKIYEDAGFEKVKADGILPDDTSDLFFILQKKETRAIYFDSFGNGADTYRLTFAAMEDYHISVDILTKIISIFDENISEISRIDEHNYQIVFSGQKQIISDKELIYKLSSGTTKGMLLYILMAASLQNGFDLIVDEIENHFHKTLVENMISLYKDKSVNRHGATLIFTTHYCELLDLFNRQDNIYIAKAEGKVTLTNMYSGYHVRSELLKSRQFYSNVFQTAVNYDELMALKKELKR